MEPTDRSPRLEREGAPVRLEDVHKWFGNLHVLKGIDLTMDQRDVVVVDRALRLGEVHAPAVREPAGGADEGRVLFEGRDITDIRTNLNEVRTHIGIVFQAYNLFPHKTALRNITLALEKVLDLRTTRPRNARMESWHGRDGAQGHAYPGQLPVGSSSAWLSPGPRDGAEADAVRRGHLRARPRAGREVLEVMTVWPTRA